MRLGAYDCMLEPGTLAARAYGELADQRASPSPLRVQQPLQGAVRRASVCVFSGHHAVGRTSLVEIVELPPELHPWFVGTQAHPEFNSRPTRPSPLYRDFIGADPCPCDEAIRVGEIELTRS